MRLIKDTDGRKTGSDYYVSNGKKIVVTIVIEDEKRASLKIVN